MKRLAVFPALLAVVAPLCVFCEAVPVEWSVADGGNGHFYEAVSVAGVISWGQANVAAAEAGGYLVTITSEQENEFVFNLIDSPSYWYEGYNLRGPWIGAYQAPRSVEPAGGWQWVTGEPFAYTNWDTGQPNNMGGSEDRIYFGNQPVRVPRWNDAPADFTEVRAYVVEYVPEPATMIIVALGSAIMARGRGSRGG